jgi:hypothetical protein
MDEQEGLIREVNEAMRQEKLQRFLTYFGRYIVLGSVAIVLATLAYVGWQSHVNAGYEASTEKFYYAIKQIEAGKAFQAREAFEEIAEGDDAELAMLAKLWLVKLKAQAGKPDEAAEMVRGILKETEGKKSFDSYRDWLTLYLPPSEAPADNIFRITNLERLAMVSLKDGKQAEAAALLQRIVDDTATPATMRERATLILSTSLKNVVVQKPSTVDAKQNGKAERSGIIPPASESQKSSEQPKAE